MNMMHWQGTHFMGFGWLLQLLILVLFFIVVWWMLRQGQQYGYRASPSETAKDILDKRLAKGDITTAEYRKLRKEIGDNGT